MEENKNMVPIKAEIVEGKKKKHTVRNVIIAVVAIFFLLALWIGDSDDSVNTPASNTEEVQQKTQVEQTEETERVEKEKEVVVAAAKEETLGVKNDGRYYFEIGNSYPIKSNGSDMEWEYTVADINIARSVSPLDSTDNYIFYIDLEVSNKDDEDKLTLTDTAIKMYVDDFQVNTDSWYGYMDTVFPGIECETIAVNPGRKTKFRYYAAMPVSDANAANSIELELNGLVALFKDNGEWQYGLEQIAADQKEAEHKAMVVDQVMNGIGGEPGDIVCGRYHVAVNLISGRNEAYVQPYTDSEDNPYVITIYCTDSQGYQVGDFAGYLRNDGDYYTVVDGSCDMEYAHVTFFNNGMSIETINNEDYESRYGVPLRNYAGSYYLDEALNFDEVG